MTTIFERVDAALTTLNVPFAVQHYRTTTGQALPDPHITYALVSSAGRQHADDDETARMSRIQVNVWSRSGLVNLPDIDGAMRAAGFRAAGKRQLPDDPDDGWFGLAQDYTILEDTNHA
jgi:hypothetical protein